MATAVRDRLASTGIELRAAGMRLLPAGRTAVLVELDDAGQRRRLHRTLSEHPAVGTVDLVPAPDDGAHRRRVARSVTGSCRSRPGVYRRRIGLR